MSLKEKRKRKMSFIGHYTVNQTYLKPSVCHSFPILPPSFVLLRKMNFLFWLCSLLLKANCAYRNNISPITSFSLLRLINIFVLFHTLKKIWRGFNKIVPRTIWLSQDTWKWGKCVRMTNIQNFQALLHKTYKIQFILVLDTLQFILV